MRLGGRLEEWIVVERIKSTGDYKILIGKIFGDSRWPDGTTIETSEISKIKGDKVFTENTRYTLGKEY